MDYLYYMDWALYFQVYHKRPIEIWYKMWVSEYNENLGSLLKQISHKTKEKVENTYEKWSQFTNMNNWCTNNKRRITRQLVSTSNMCKQVFSSAPSLYELLALQFSYFHGRFCCISSFSLTLFFFVYSIVQLRQEVFGVDIKDGECNLTERITLFMSLTI